MAKLLLGKEVTDALNANLQTRTAALREKGVTPTLGIIRVGENPSDLSYEKGAVKRAELVGVNVVKFVLPEDATKADVLAAIDKVNADDSIHGVLMFRPLPKHLKADQTEICNRLDPKKDVDCMTDLSNAGVFEGRSDLGFAPCTPAACMEILDYYGIDCKGKNAVVIGRSLVVGKPAAMMLMGKNATVTVCPHQDRQHRRDCPECGHSGVCRRCAGQPDQGIRAARPGGHRRVHQLGRREAQRQGRQGVPLPATPSLRKWNPSWRPLPPCPAAWAA